MDNLITVLNEVSDDGIEFTLKENDGKIRIGWKFKYLKDENYYGDYIETNPHITGDDIGEAVSLLFGQLCGFLDALKGVE